MLHRAELGVAGLQAEGLLGDSEECATLIGEGNLELADAGTRGGELLLAEEFFARQARCFVRSSESDIRAGVRRK